MRRIGFRARLFGILLLFAIVPALAVTLAWWSTVSEWVPLVSGNVAWERVGHSGESAIRAVRAARLTGAQRAAVDAHEQELSQSLVQARRFQFVADRLVPVLLLGSLTLVFVLGVVGSRVAGHLSRQLSRPIHELVGWTERVARGAPLPDGPPRKGAPEFAVLRSEMRRMAREIEVGRERAVEAERSSAFRETARQVAHELKNPLTPIRFAVARLRREAPPALAEVVEVLAVESQRLEEMARSFAAFGRLPDGPVADVDLAELARYTATATVPPDVTLDLAIDEPLPMVRGHHDALARALSNVLINAVEAVRGCAGARVRVEVSADAMAFPPVARTNNGARPVRASLVRITVRDTGVGIPPEQLARIWDPYVTTKPGGTGLGLAIARQTIIAHRGDVDATSEPGRGTAITFTLPIDADDDAGENG